ncbi:carboxypeptidase-like regulatory domain-containing protein [Deinococcus sp. HMF7604]|uniref:carboxypeptidase-like regulatory domain-containing protein n=1 Tax=Deinococcus betulae TaxID=2873312 RepID=UPI001CCF9EBC|nr:carboxypeptidase-like regulatory domain-containing protein [Deinococcus betulae]MBZ9749888.1 carboxypeptidase-like regulatory domain-containing protein [Deinococcus betulae]
MQNVTSLALLTAAGLGSLALGAASRPVPYVMTGVVKTAGGQPVPGVEVYADNTVYYDMNVVAKTDAKGRYRIELPHNVGKWRPGATLERNYQGDRFRMTIYPNDRAAFQSTTGAVRDFVWKLNGPYEGGVLGEQVNVYHGDGIAYGDLIVTLTPEGPLIDGSQGKALVIRPTTSVVKDVPLGRYRMTAKLSTGQPVLVQAEGSDTWAASAVNTFKNNMYGIRMSFSTRLP